MIPATHPHQKIFVASFQSNRILTMTLFPYATKEIGAPTVNHAATASVAPVKAARVCFEWLVTGNGATATLAVFYDNFFFPLRKVCPRTTTRSFSTQPTRVFTVDFSALGSGLTFSAAYRLAPPSFTHFICRLSGVGPRAQSDTRE